MLIQHLVATASHAFSLLQNSLKETTVVVVNLPCFSVLLGRPACGCCDANYELWRLDSSVCKL